MAGTGSASCGLTAKRHEENDMNRNVGISLGGLILLLIIVAILF
jgi:hypothetical protein